MRSLHEAVRPKPYYASIGMLTHIYVCLCKVKPYFGGVFAVMPILYTLDSLWTNPALFYALLALGMVFSEMPRPVRVVLEPILMLTNHRAYRPRGAGVNGAIHCFNIVHIWLV